MWPTLRFRSGSCLPIRLWAAQTFFLRPDWTLLVCDLVTAAEDAARDMLSYAAETKYES